MNRNLTIKKFFLGFFLTLLLLLLAFLSIKTGEFKISIIDLISWNFDPKLKHIIINLRLTRTLAAIISGAALGVSGCVLQNVLRNQLASPFTLGVAQGGAFGASFAIIFLSSMAHFKFLLVSSAFLGSMIAIVAILLLTFIVKVTSGALILAGVALSYFFSAGIMLLQYFGTDIQVASSVFWTFGDLSKATWGNISVMFIVLIPLLIFFLYNSWSYNAFIWGEDTARSLGVDTRFLIISTMVLSSLLTAVTIAFLGVIGFIGLIAPHLVRMIIGSDYRFLVPYSAITGSALLLLSDIISRVLLSPIVLPVGIITSFVGVPLFLFILIRGKLKR